MCHSVLSTTDDLNAGIFSGRRQNYKSSWQQCCKKYCLGSFRSDRRSHPLQHLESEAKWVWKQASEPSPVRRGEGLTTTLGLHVLIPLCRSYRVLMTKRFRSSCLYTRTSHPICANVHQRIRHMMLVSLTYFTTSLNLSHRAQGNLLRQLWAKNLLWHWNKLMCGSQMRRNDQTLNSRRSSHSARRLRVRCETFGKTIAMTCSTSGAFSLLFYLTYALHNSL